MDTQPEALAQDDARLPAVLARLAALTAEGSPARAALVRQLERVLRDFEARKGENLETLVRILGERLQTLPADVTTAVLFGSAVRDELEPDSDIDLLLIADGLSQLEAQAHFKAAGRELHRPVNVVVYSSDGWLGATKSAGSLAQGISSQPVVLLAGTLPRG